MSIHSAQPLDETLEDILARQSLVFRARDVHRWLGLDEIRAEVAAGRWRHPHWGVYVAHNGELTPEQERWVCLLCAPAGSALGGLTAAAIDGFDGFDSDYNHIVIPIGSRRPRRARLVSHYSSTLTEDEVHPARHPRRTRPARSIVDAATWAASAKHARTIVLASVQQGLVRPEDLHDVLTRPGQGNHHAVIRESIDDAAGGIASVPEHEFDGVRRRFRLPVPDRQACVRGRDGRYYLDAGWKRYRLAAEIHGSQHLHVPNWDADLDRHNQLTADGWLVLQFSSYSIRHSPDDVGTILLQALRNAGWNG